MLRKRGPSRLILPVVAMVVAAGSGCAPSGDPPLEGREGLETPVALASGLAEPRAEAPFLVTRALLGRGGTLDSALERLGVPEPLRPGVLAALRPHVNPRRLPRETGLAAAWRSEDDLASVSCRMAHDRFVRVTIHPDGRCTSEILEVPVRTFVETAGGVVQTSVTQALSDAWLSDRLTVLFSDIFQWDVDLFVDPRPGDRVRLVYEVLLLGEAPLDIPRYGTSPLHEGAFLGIGRVLAASYEGKVAQSVAYWIEDDGRKGGYYDEKGRSLRKTFLKSPLNYRRISSRFSRARRHPVTRKVVPHHGVDFAAPIGTPVVAAAAGRVVSAGWEGALGRAIRVRHGHGYTTVYGHLRGFAQGIRRGARISQNQVVGYVGLTGRATGPHLHYTLLKNGRPIDPLVFLNPSTEPLPPEHLPHLDMARSRWLPVLRSIHLDTADVELARGDRPGEVTEETRGG